MAGFNRQQGGSFGILGRWLVMARRMRASCRMIANGWHMSARMIMVMSCRQQPATQHVGNQSDRCSPGFQREILAKTGAGFTASIMSLFAAYLTNSHKHKGNPYKECVNHDRKPRMMGVLAKSPHQG